jgi:hypothetical protein
LVEIIILVMPIGGFTNTACCSSLDKDEWSGWITHLKGNKNTVRIMAQSVETGWVGKLLSKLITWLQVSAAPLHLSSRLSWSN